ncbi:hypothetical protein F7725_008446 [Dissostichus mawsoni]|uniref:Uncharacterized protein n=1 Tax=Dissostichus mawsoni TaxID=36200 RepID=A0A7J5Y848_DISMA|nr:hypothetical protein F7725_008446 [Dissostichus mawsoni]
MLKALLRALTLSKWLKEARYSFSCSWLMPLASLVKIWFSISLMVRAMVRLLDQLVVSLQLVDLWLVVDDVLLVLTEGPITLAWLANCLRRRSLFCCRACSSIRAWVDGGVRVSSGHVHVVRLHDLSDLVVDPEDRLPLFVRLGQRGLELLVSCRSSMAPSIQLLKGAARLANSRYSWSMSLAAFMGQSSQSVPLVADILTASVHTGESPGFVDRCFLTELLGQMVESLQSADLVEEPLLVPFLRTLQTPPRIVDVLNEEKETNT